LAVALALSPILVLGAFQAWLSFDHDARHRRFELTQAAVRSAASARAQMRAAAVLMQSVSPATVGLECAPRLAQLLELTDGYLNFVRFNAQGRVQCAAASVRSGAVDRQPWFEQLKTGAPVAIAGAPSGLYAERPALLAAMRTDTADGAFGGALVSVLSIQSLQPQAPDGLFMDGAEAALLDRDGKVVSPGGDAGFGDLPPDWRQSGSKRGGFSYHSHDRKGALLDVAIAPLIPGELYVALSSPSPGLVNWARFNALSSVLLPLLAWIAAWAAVWLVADRVVIRWLHYLDRVAAIYARGRFSVRPVQAEDAPQEIRALAATLDTMADAIVARDLSLRESLAQKDTMMREIHHRVKNNLQVITSLLNMQQRAMTDPAAREAMSDTRQRITALALIYRALYQSPDLRLVDVRQFLEELVAQLSSGESGRPSNIRTQLSADDFEIDPDKLPPLALFAVEAITNARKHAFGPAGGAIDVSFRVRPNEISLDVTDDGMGGAVENPGGGGGPHPDERLRATAARPDVDRHRRRRGHPRKANIPAARSASPDGDGLSAFGAEPLTG
jgi:two-component sensor histidine kinase